MNKIIESNDHVVLECPHCHDIRSYYVDEILEDGLIICPSCEEEFYEDDALMQHRRKVAESTEKPEPKKYQVVRCSNHECSLDADIANIKDTVVFEFDDQKDAEDKAKYLNTTVTPGEIELLGTNYKVQELKLDEMITILDKGTISESCPDYKSCSDSKIKETLVNAIKDNFDVNFCKVSVLDEAKDYTELLVRMTPEQFTAMKEETGLTDLDFEILR